MIAQAKSQNYKKKGILKIIPFYEIFCLLKRIIGTVEENCLACVFPYLSTRQTSPFFFSRDKFLR